MQGWIHRFKLGPFRSPTASQPTKESTQPPYSILVTVTFEWGQTSGRTAPDLHLRTRLRRAPVSRIGARNVFLAPTGWQPGREASSNPGQLRAWSEPDRLSGGHKMRSFLSGALRPCGPSLVTELAPRNAPLRDVTVPRDSQRADPVSIAPRFKPWGYKKHQPSRSRGSHGSSGGFSAQRKNHLRPRERHRIAVRVGASRSSSVQRRARAPGPTCAVARRHEGREWYEGFCPCTKRRRQP